MYIFNGLKVYMCERLCRQTAAPSHHQVAMSLRQPKHPGSLGSLFTLRSIELLKSATATTVEKFDAGRRNQHWLLTCLVPSHEIHGCSCIDQPCSVNFEINIILNDRFTDAVEAMNGISCMVSSQLSPTGAVECARHKATLSVQKCTWRHKNSFIILLQH